MEPATGSPGGAPDVVSLGDDFSLREASRLYAVERATLQGLVRRARIDAYKVRGPWGREWRVTRSALEAEGYERRSAGKAVEADHERVNRLERELAVARRAAATERRRADEADRRLGESLMESGRLRAALAVFQRHAPQDDLPAVDMDELRHVLIDLRASGRSTGRS